MSECGWLDALRPDKNRPKPLRVRALVMTIGLNLPTRILNAQVEARKEENYGAEDLQGMIKKLEPRVDGTMCLKNRKDVQRFEKALLVAPNMNAEVRVPFWQFSFQKLLNSIRFYEYGQYQPKQMVKVSRTIKLLRRHARSCVMDFGKGWDKHLPLIEFSYNNSYHTSIKAAPFEALYGRKYRSPNCAWGEVGRSATRPEIVRVQQRRLSKSCFVYKLPYRKSAM
ncbi:putative reverse transcriptase domain-containing protein [Tanacetum coccineum]